MSRFDLMDNHQYEIQFLMLKLIKWLIKNIEENKQNYQLDIHEKVIVDVLILRNFQTER